MNNKLINGDFSQWQRGSTFSTAGYTADRWKSSAAVSSNRVFGPQGLLYGLTVATTTTIQQPIELPLVGRAGEFYNGSTWVLSWYSTNSAITPFVQFRDDSSDETNFVNVTVGAKAVVETVGSWVRYKAVVTIDADPAGTSECLSVLLSCAGATSISGVQFEKGGLSAFEQRPVGMELSLCQRYYEIGRWSYKETYPTQGAEAYVIASFKVTKRIPPSIPDMGVIVNDASRLDGVWGSSNITEENFIANGTVLGATGSPVGL